MYTILTPSMILHSLYTQASWFPVIYCSLDCMECVHEGPGR